MTSPVAKAAAYAGLCAASVFHCDPTQAVPPPGELLRNVEFTFYSEHTRNAELVLRLVSPLRAAQLQQELARAGKTMAEQPLDLSHERFTIYVPPRGATRLYGLLVFVPPWADARVPDGWTATLDRHGIIFVSAARSGNDEPVLGRREPLALLAVENVLRRFPVDPRRVYVAGFSGGSRIALRLALGYPDVFRGAILNAGSDPIGTAEVVLPPRSQFEIVQASSHFVYITGARDAAHLNDDLLSIRSLRDWCVYAVDDQILPQVEHAVAGPVALSWALDRLDAGAHSDPGRLAACQAAIDAEVAAKLGTVRAMIDGGRRVEAMRALVKIDDRFGGLAAPLSLELANR